MIEPSPGEKAITSSTGVDYLYFCRYLYDNMLSKECQGTKKL